MSRAGDRGEKEATARRRYYHPTQKVYATLLRTSEETGGERTLIEVEVAPGGGTDPHYHLTYEECFEVLEGALEVLVDKETGPCAQGRRRSSRERRSIASATLPTIRPRSWSS